MRRLILMRNDAGTGPGSRGGHITGWSNGKPIYGSKQPKHLSHVPDRGYSFHALKVKSEAGSTVTVELHRNPTAKHLEKVQTNARAWIMPNGDFVVGAHGGRNPDKETRSVWHRTVAKAMKQEGLLTPAQHKATNSQFTTKGSNMADAVAVQRVGKTNVFALGENNFDISSLFTETHDKNFKLLPKPVKGKNTPAEEDRLNAVKGLMREAGKRSGRSISFMPRLIDEVEKHLDKKQRTDDARTEGK
jgi:hypothetical protein